MQASDATSRLQKDNERLKTNKNKNKVTIMDQQINKYSR